MHFSFDWDLHSLHNSTLLHPQSEHKGTSPCHVVAKNFSYVSAKIQSSNKPFKHIKASLSLDVVTLQILVPLLTTGLLAASAKTEFRNSSTKLHMFFFSVISIKVSHIVSLFCFFIADWLHSSHYHSWWYELYVVSILLKVLNMHWLHLDQS